jgi:hypothetical protein
MHSCFISLIYLHICMLFNYLLHYLTVLDNLINAYKRVTQFVAVISVLQRAATLNTHATISSALG